MNEFNGHYTENVDVVFLIRSFMHVITNFTKYTFNIITKKNF